MSAGNQGAAKLQPSSRDRAAEIIGTRAKVNVSQKEEVADSRATNIQSNPFYQIVFNASLEPEEKQHEVAKVLATVGTEAENNERVAALEGIKEFLQLEREKMASKIIALTDTDTMARLQQVYQDMNNGLLLFNEDLQPILEIVDAMHVVRKEGKTNELFSEIREDRKGETEFNLKHDTIKQNFENTQNLINELNDENASLSEEKSFFGFGGVTQAARSQIAVNEVTIEKLKSDLVKFEKDLVELNKEAPVSQVDDSEFGKAKQTIRNGLLDLSSDEHKENQKKVVQRALDFVKTSKDSLGAIRGHIVGMNDQIGNLSDANYKMTSAYAILGEGIKEANVEVIKEREKLTESVEGESMIAKLDKETKIRVIDKHTTLLQNSATDTELTYADLSTQASRIRTMADANTNQMEKVKKLHVTGVASVADRLAVTLQAVSQATLSESSSIAKDTLTQMNDATNEIAMKESLRVAYQSQEVNSDLVKAMEDLATYGEITRAATTITKESVSEMKQNLEDLKTIANSLQDDLKSQGAVYSEAGEVKKETVTVNVTPQSSNNPFKL